MRHFTGLAIGILLGLVAGVLISIAVRPERVSAMPASTFAGRKFYLTKNTVQGNQALSACSAGYHMASLWEIYDVSELSYDTTLGKMEADSGSGPPNGPDVGWIRSGSSASGGLLQDGVANCNAWQSNSANDAGSSVLLNSLWPGPSAKVTIGSWLWGGGAAHGQTCNTQKPVWCVAN